MKAFRWASAAGVALTIWVCGSEAGFARTNYYRRPAAKPATNSTNAPAAPKPDPNDKMFKEIPVDTVFVYPTDKAHKWFQWVKISETQARSMVSASHPAASVEKIPSERMIYIVDGKSKK